MEYNILPGYYIFAVLQHTATVYTTLIAVLLLKSSINSLTSGSLKNK